MKLFGKMFPREEDEEFRDLSDKPEMEAALREAMKPAEEQDLVMKIEGLERRNTSKLPPLKLAEESPAAQAAPEAPEELDPLQKSVHEMLNKKYAEATKAAADAAETVQEALPDREELPALELSAEAADSLEEAVPELPALELSEAEDFAAEAAEPELPALELPEIEAEEPAAEQELPELEAETPEQAEPEQELPEAEAPSLPPKRLTWNSLLRRSPYWKPPDPPCRSFAWTFPSARNRRSPRRPSPPPLRGIRRSPP